MFDGSQMSCKFCLKKGHGVDFCPALPTEPLPEEKHPFLERIINSPRVQLDTYEGCSWEKAGEKIQQQGRLWNQGNPWMNMEGPEYHLKKNIGFWKAIGADKVVLSWIGYGVDMRFYIVPNRVRFPNLLMTKIHENFVEDELKLHLLDGLAIEVTAHEAHLVHPLLVVENKKGKLRLCDDLRFPNAFQASPAFKMQSLTKDVPEIVKEGDTLFTRDLEKAYYKVMMAKQARKFQTRHWKGKYCQMLCLLFGWCNSPFVFTKICKPIVRLLGALLTRVLNFIDDWLFPSKHAEQERLKGFIENLFSALGWTFNKKQEEGTSVEFLGFIIDAVKRMFVVPSNKVMVICSRGKGFITRANGNQMLSTACLLSWLGQLVSCRLAIPAISVWSRELYTPWRNLGENGVVSPMTHISEQMKEELLMLVDLVKERNGAPFMNQKSELDIYCDASEIGWGAFLLHLQVSGLFKDTVVGSSSTFRELHGLMQCISDPEVQELITHKALRINMDSRPALMNMMKGGGPVLELCRQVKAISIVLTKLDVKTSYRWLSRESLQMKKADMLSKTTNFWLDQEFANMLASTYQCDIMCPGYTTIPNVLSVLSRRTKPAGIVVPRWEAKSWWVNLVEMAFVLVSLEDKVIVFENCKRRPNWKFCLALFL